MNLDGSGYLIRRIKKRWRRNTSYSMVDIYLAGKLSTIIILKM